MEVTCESWNGRHADDDFVLLVVLKGAYDTFYDCCADFVADWVLGVVCCCDEELVLDVDEVLACPDSLNIGIGDGVLYCQYFPRF